MLSVADVQRLLRQHLEGRFGTLSVRGEVSNLRVQSSGHAYFTLKDRRAQLKCVLFADERRRLKFRLADGLSIVATGRVTVYDRTGTLQLRVMGCEPEGEGALWAQFQERARKLRAEGLTDAARKRPVPTHPSRVGVVTSRTGAALRDIVRTLIRRDPSVRIRICHAMVQGSRATGDLVSALRCLDRFGDCDVVIVARGGGSIEDLWAFNEEPVARAIAACSVPVIVGVGHETDLTIADMVADRSASTPTAAAAAAVPDHAEILERLRAIEARLGRAIAHDVGRRRHRLDKERATLELAQPAVHRWAQHLDHLQHRAMSAVASRVAGHQAALRTRHQRLSSAAPAVRLGRARAALERMPARLRRAMQEKLTECVSRLTQAERSLSPSIDAYPRAGRATLAQRTAQLEALSPLAVLHRGYALASTEGGELVRDADRLNEGDNVEIRVAKGRFTATVTGTSEDAPSPSTVPVDGDGG